MKNRNSRDWFLYPSQIGFSGTVGMFCTDPLGMYTGVGLDPLEKPVQDADDL